MESNTPYNRASEEQSQEEEFEETSLMEPGRLVYLNPKPHYCGSIKPLEYVPSKNQVKGLGIWSTAYSLKGFSGPIL